jgi:formate dehydrogenase maturation protein FdhE
MREKCDNCGLIEDILYEFIFHETIFGYRLKFCSQCGQKIKKMIEDGVN